MATPTAVVWYRKFLRTKENDQDFVIDEAVKKEIATDYFGNFLQYEGGDTILSLDCLLKRFYDKPAYSFNIYAVADGAFIEDPARNLETVLPDKKPWFNPHIRFVAVIQPTETPPSGDKWSIFIVGSNELHSETRFLQVASWDPAINEYHFFGTHLLQKGGKKPDGSRAWIYQGRSSDAIKPSTTYLGPFNGHVNGALIMKELQRPWYHWMSGLNESITKCFSKVDIATFMEAPYLSRGGLLLSQVSGADELELYIRTGVNKWFARRSVMEFYEAGATDQKHITSGYRNLPRWMSHILLTTTINISAAKANPDRTGKEEWVAPVDHFINNVLLHTTAFSDLLPNIPGLAFTDANYQTAATDLEIWFIQEVDRDNVPPGYELLTEPPGTLGGNKESTGNMHYHRSFIKVQAGEGVPFVIVQPSYEDARGALEMQSIATATGSTISLLSDQTFNALMMVDFYNPVYSWRRGVLMRYVPETTSWCPKTQSYDFEAKFIKLVQESRYTKDPESPESQFLQLLHQGAEQHKQRISKYFSIVAKRLGTVEGLKDYLSLAESRRRVFRPVPLDEFGYTLPYALKFDSPRARDYLEMTEIGTTRQMNQRGIEFLWTWINTLWDVDPHLIPLWDVNSRKIPVSYPDTVHTGEFHQLEHPERREDYKHLHKLVGGARERKKNGFRCPFAVGAIKVVRDLDPNKTASDDDHEIIAMVTRTDPFV